MTNTSALAEKNRRIKELEAEAERLRSARASEVWSGEWRELLDRAEAAEARVKESDETAHLANGTVALALKHRDAAEARVAELEQALDEAEALIIRQRDERKAKLARADRLAEAADDLFPTARADEWGEMREALAAYRSDSPPQGEAVHPDTERLDWLDEARGESRASAWVMDLWSEGPEDITVREAIDAAREVTGEHDED